MSLRPKNQNKPYYQIQRNGEVVLELTKTLYDDIIAEVKNSNDDQEIIEIICDLLDADTAKDVLNAAGIDSDE